MWRMRGSGFTIRWPSVQPLNCGACSVAVCGRVCGTPQRTDSVAAVNGGTLLRLICKHTGTVSAGGNKTDEAVLYSGIGPNVTIKSVSLQLGLHIHFVQHYAPPALCLQHPSQQYGRFEPPVPAQPTAELEQRSSATREHSAITVRFPPTHAVSRRTAESR
jgi:hypothetical protein